MDSPELKEVEIVLASAKRLEEEGYDRNSPLFMDVLRLTVELWKFNHATPFNPYINPD